MIEERTALINQFDASLVKMELARKRELILKSRSLHLKMMQEEATKANKMLENLIRLNTPQKLATKDVGIQFEPISSPEEASQSSSSGTSSTSDSSASSSSAEGEQATESSSSASSSSSSRETVLRRNSATSTSTQASVENLRSPANNSPPSKEDKPAEEPLSPTSLYLQQLREKILRERMQKI
ncbi:hypothetical protein OESDEN_14445 [Oesophagostomum dentatum]|uniref:Uncharacterized protein n=1 Tax=Oesophagostomum dentatum TaxID=61180 RepID=A0A0B1SLK1_OESDE|nr:hypothetical protein OESDEN_14445 [Oesophagostomum dentatum]